MHCFQLFGITIKKYKSQFAVAKKSRGTFLAILSFSPPIEERAAGRGRVQERGKMKTMNMKFPARKARALLLFLAIIGLLCQPQSVRAARLKDIATVQGVRNNQLIGYGLVVGLEGTGDGKKAVFTNQSLVNMMGNLGVQLNKDQVSVRNVAGVMVTAQLPPFVKSGQTIDVVLSSLGDASSLQGGTLLPTQLKGLDGKVYAIAQGPASIGGFETENRDINQQRKHLTVARIPDGASVEREVPVSFSGKQEIVLSLNDADFTTVARVVAAINETLGGEYAKASDGATVHVVVPEASSGKEVALLARLENLEIMPDVPARVILDERTGTVVMGENVRIGKIALSHGNLSLLVSGPQPAGKEQAGKTGDTVVRFSEGASLGEIVRALNSLGVNPRDMIAIFQSIKAAGALQAELEVI